MAPMATSLPCAVAVGFRVIVGLASGVVAAADDDGITEPDLQPWASIRH
jgi:hypothetical protein